MLLDNSVALVREVRSRSAGVLAAVVTSWGGGTFCTGGFFLKSFNIASVSEASEASGFSGAPGLKSGFFALGAVGGGTVVTAAAVLVVLPSVPLSNC